MSFTVAPLVSNLNVKKKSWIKLEFFALVTEYKMLSSAIRFVTQLFYMANIKLRS